jgi:hypothetical protein
LGGIDHLLSVIGSDRIVVLELGLLLLLSQMLFLSMLEYGGRLLSLAIGVHFSPLLGFQLNLCLSLRLCCGCLLLLLPPLRIFVIHLNRRESSEARECLGIGAMAT